MAWNSRRRERSRKQKKKSSVPNRTQPCRERLDLSNTIVEGVFGDQTTPHTPPKRRSGNPP